MDPCGAFPRGVPWSRAVVAGSLLVLLTLFSLALLLSIAEAAPPTIPTPYHNGSTLICSQCHSMHASQQHSYTGSSSVSPPSGPPETYPWTTTPTAKLMRRASAAQMCLACHDGRTGVPDVVEADVNGLGDNRAAGFFAALDTDNYKGHKLAANPGSDLCSRCHFAGTFPTASVTCTDCHNPHGNSGYRNLQWASSPNDPSQPKIIAFAGATGIQKYNQNNIGYSAPQGDNTWREVTNICIDCHHTFLSDSGGYYTGNTSPYIRHPNTNSEWGFFAPINRPGANTDPGHWVDGTGSGFEIPRLKFLVRGATSFGEATTVAPGNEVFCLSCHQAHGSANAFGLRWDYGTGPAGTRQAGCQQCHNR